MHIVLLQDVENLGKQYEVKEVKDGYARNFLIPRGLAKLADEQAQKWAKEQQALIAEKAAQELERIGELASQIDGLEIEIPVKLGDKGQLFEKVTDQKIALALQELGYNIKKGQVELSEEIADLGEYEAKVKFEHGLEANLKIIVAETLAKKE